MAALRARNRTQIRAASSWTQDLELPITRRSRSCIAHHTSEMIGNRYKKIEKGGAGAGIGSGTYGEVFKCEDSQTGELVACKVSSRPRACLIGRSREPVSVQNWQQLACNRTYCMQVTLSAVQASRVVPHFSLQSLNPPCVCITAHQDRPGG